MFLLRQTFDARFVRAEEAEATILLRYAADGKLLEMVLEERSGDAGFDAALLSAIRRSVPRIPEAPLPPGSEGQFAMRIRFRGSS